MLSLAIAAVVILPVPMPAVAVVSRPAGQPQAPATAAVSPAKRAEAYFQFMRGRSLEADGEIEEAIKAFRAAAAAQPTSAEIRAELAGLFARQNQVREAVEEARAALELDKACTEAHKVLGLVFAALARPDQESSRGDADRIKYATDAVGHFEAMMAGRPGSSFEPGVQLTLARLYLMTGAPAKAIPIVTGLIADVPQATELVPLLADAYTGAGRNDEAIEVLEGASAERPALLGALAALYERQGRWTDAAKAYEKAIAAFPRNPDLRSRLAFALLNEGGRARAVRARDLLDAAVKDDPTNTRLLFLLSQAQRIAGALDEAEATARALMARDSSGTWGMSALAEILSERRDYRRLIDELAPAVAASPPARDAERGRGFGGVLVALGIAYQEVGEHDRAIAAFDRARPLYGDSATGDLYAARARLEARRFDEGLALLREARTRHPADPRLVRVEADALRRMDRLDEGTALLDAEVASRPDEVTPRLALAELLLAARRHDRAETVLREAVTKFPDDEMALFQLGAVLERQKRFDEAERIFRAVIARSPDNALALNYLGYMLADRGQKLEEAVALIRRALDLDPHNGSYLDSLGWAYFRLKQYTTAEPYLRRAAEQQPRNSIIQVHYGDLLERLGRLDQAIAAWQRALDGDAEELDRAAVERKLAAARAKLPGRRPSPAV